MGPLEDNFTIKPTNINIGDNRINEKREIKMSKNLLILICQAGMYSLLISINGVP